MPRTAARAGNIRALRTYSFSAARPGFASRDHRGQRVFDGPGGRAAGMIRSSTDRRPRRRADRVVKRPGKGRSFMTAAFLHRFMPYGAPDLLDAARPSLARALAGSSAAATPAVRGRVVREPGAGALRGQQSIPIVIAPHQMEQLDHVVLHAASAGDPRGRDARATPARGGRGAGPGARDRGAGQHDGDGPIPARHRGSARGRPPVPRSMCRRGLKGRSTSPAASRSSISFRKPCTSCSHTIPTSRSRLRWRDS